LSLQFWILVIIGIILIGILVYKEHQIKVLENNYKISENNVELVSTEYNSLYKNTSDITKEYNEVNKLIGLYREKYGILQKEDLDTIRQKRKLKGNN
jgi:uncharacterized membrane protein YgaE (UPF0421/DUF939 family)